ncbi:Protoporphyrinogen oxidase [Xylariaceae sp. FL1272]|nr:Protoporphyrinogen oxidase [Xylariaceae sp. FL1272]
MISQRPEDVFIRLLRTAYSHATHQWTPRRLGAFSNVSGTRCLSSQTRPTRPVRVPIEGGRLLGSPILGCHIRRQEYATSTAEQEKPREIAVLGGGITGLTTAHYLARHAENSHITIYEASDKLGGWIKADRVDVEANGEKSHVLLQQGPRMLRSGANATKYDDLVLYDVLANLNMGDKIRHPETVSDNRYIYYPDHLVKLPTNALEAIQSWLKEPLYNGSLKAAYNYWVQTNKLADPRVRFRPLTENPRDETVLEFVERLTGDDQIAHNIVSGMFHGIYGGDIAKLSAKHTVLENFWLSTQPGAYTDGGLAWMHWKDVYLLFDMLNGPNKLKVIELAENAVDTKLLAFEDGLLSLVEGLKKDLESQRNVTFRYREPVTALEHQDGQILVSSLGSTEPKKYDHVICTLFSKQLAEIAQPANSLPSLAETHAVTIMSVTLYYPNPHLLAEGGFGYLIPSSTPDNTEDALGVLFDSDLKTGGSEAPGTKLTVMLGGHYWDELDILPTEEEGITMAKEVVNKHLGIPLDQEVITSVRLCEDCLPQHFLGHRDRMNKAHYELLSTFQGKLTVAGPSYTSVGVIPAMRAGFDAAMRVARGHKQPWFPNPIPSPASELGEEALSNWWERLQNSDNIFDHVGATGLEIFTEMEWATMYRGMKRDTLFRKFSQRELRFRDDEGKLLDVKQRITSNSPLQHKPKE